MSDSAPSKIGLFSRPLQIQEPQSQFGAVKRSASKPPIRENCRSWDASSAAAHLDSLPKALPLFGSDSAVSAAKDVDRQVQAEAKVLSTTRNFDILKIPLDDFPDPPAQLPGQVPGSLGVYDADSRGREVKPACGTQTFNQSTVSTQRGPQCLIPSIMETDRTRDEFEHTEEQPAANLCCASQASRDTDRAVAAASDKYPAAESNSASRGALPDNISGIHMETEPSKANDPRAKKRKVLQDFRHTLPSVSLPTYRSAIEWAGVASASTAPKRRQPQLNYPRGASRPPEEHSASIPGVQACTASPRTYVTSKISLRPSKLLADAQSVTSSCRTELGREKLTTRAESPTSSAKSLPNTIVDHADLPEVRSLLETQNLRCEISILKSQLQDQKESLNLANQEAKEVKRCLTEATHDMKSQATELEKALRWRNDQGLKVKALRQSHHKVEKALGNVLRDAEDVHASIRYFDQSLTDLSGEIATVRASAASSIENICSSAKHSAQSMKIVREIQVVCQNERVLKENLLVICDRNAGTMSEDRNRIADLTKQVSTMIDAQNDTQKLHLGQLSERDTKISELLEETRSLSSKVGEADSRTITQMSETLHKMRDEMSNHVTELIEQCCSQRDQLEMQYTVDQKAKAEDLERLASLDQTILQRDVATKELETLKLVLQKNRMEVIDLKRALQEETLRFEKMEAQHESK